MQMIEEPETLSQCPGSGLPSTIASFSALPKPSDDPFVTSSPPASFANSLMVNEKVPITTTTAHMAAKTHVTPVLIGTSCSPIVSSEKPPLNVESAEFSPITFVKGTTSTPYDNYGLEIAKEKCHRALKSQAPTPIERTFQDVMALQHKQNETIIATYQ